HFDDVHAATAYMLLRQKQEGRQRAAHASERRLILDRPGARSCWGTSPMRIERRQKAGSPGAGSSGAALSIPTDQAVRECRSRQKLWFSLSRPMTAWFVVFKLSGVVFPSAAPEKGAPRPNMVEELFPRSTNSPSAPIVKCWSHMCSTPKPTVQPTRV